MVLHRGWIRRACSALQKVDGHPGFDLQSRKRIMALVGWDMRNMRCLFVNHIMCTRAAAFKSAIRFYVDIVGAVILEGLLSTFSHTKKCFVITVCSALLVYIPISY